jgi:transposase
MQSQSTSQNDAVASNELEFAAFVGVDWADMKSSLCLQIAGSEQYQFSELDNKPEAVERWAADLHAQFGGRCVAVSIEQSRGRVVYQLSKFAHIVVFIVHPNMAASFRSALHPSGSKSDPVDARLLLELLLHHRDHLRRLDPDTVETRLLRILVEQRRKIVDQKTAQSNRLTDALKLSFPQVLDWIDDIDSPMGCDLIQRWPTLEALQRSHPGTLKRFFTQHNSHSAERIRIRIEQIYQAVPAVHDKAIVEGYEMVARHCTAIIKTLQVTIDELDQKIKQLTDDHPEAPLFRNLPGAGPALLPRLIVAFGTQRDRYACAGDLQNHAGISPVTIASGRQKVVRWRFSCPKFLRQSFHEWASHSIRKCSWARCYYQSQRDKGKSHQAAVRSLAFKWIRILFRCWQDGKPYDEEIYLRSLAKRNSPFA